MKDKRMKLSSKIYLGFGTILLIAIILGVYALINLGKIQNESNKLANEYVPEVEIANRIERYSLDSMYEIRGYLYSENEKYLDAGKKALASVNDGLKDADKLANESKNLVRLKGSVDAINESVDKYENKVGETVEVNKAIAGNREQLDKAAGNYISTANELLEGQNNEFKKEIRANASGAALLERLQKITWINDLIDLGNGVRIANFKAQATRDLESLKLTMTSFDDIEKVYAKTRKITRQPQDIENLNSVRQAALNYKAAMTNYLKNAQELRILNGEQDKIGSLVVQKARELSIAGMAGADEIAKTNSSLTSTSYFSLIIGLIIAVLVGAILSFTITNGITKTLNAIVNELRSSAKQIFMAARELSNASQELASSSNEQASSIEETSSSLEELSGMVRNNLDNAQNGYDLSLKVKTVSDDGMNSMKELESAMNQIKESNQQIEELVRVIGNIGDKTKVMDEIVFQTKLLSFNASVEAERAGEHGRGFAVVAQEVGNLAQMSGQSAKEIAEIVNTSIKQAEQITTENRTKVDQGVNLVDSTSKVLFTITESANTVADGAKQILEASNEQNSGIQQINIAVGEVDKAVQENAATAEETASTSEELSSQTEVLNGIVEDIYILVHGQVMDGQAIGAEAKKVVKATSVKKTNLAPKITQPTKEEESKQASNTTGAQTHSDDAWDTL